MKSGRILLVCMVVLILCACPVVTGVSPGLAPGDPAGNMNVPGITWVWNESRGNILANESGVPGASPTVYVTVALETPIASPSPAGLAEGSPVAPVTSVTPVPPEVSNSSCTSCGCGEEEYPLMHFSPAQQEEEQVLIDTAPQYPPARRALTRSVSLAATGSKSLLPYLPYVPSERAQGECGNCWVWASTGALEIDHAIKTGIKDRLSIQYFNSKYNDGSGSSWACCGGFLNTFTDWYAIDKTPVPWSNTNASYGDGRSTCEDYQSVVPLNTISTIPNYTLKSISYTAVTTYHAGQSTAINNIKSAILANKSLYYSYNLNETGWQDFRDFWRYSNESAVFDPTPYNESITAGGHGVLLVGYDDTDPANAYWIVVNSWGTTANRSQGLFRLKMNINYDAVYYSTSGGRTYGPYQQHKFLFLDSTFADISPVADFNGVPVSGTAPLTVTFIDNSTSTPTSWNWSFGDGDTTNATSKNPVHTYSAIGNFTVSLTATNAAGSNTKTRTGYILVTGSPADRARLVIPAASLYQNTATKIPVRVANITGGTGISFNLTYDPSVIRVNEITLNQSYASGSNLAVNKTDGLIRASLTNTDGLTIGSPVPVFLINTTSTSAVGSQTALDLNSALWSDGTFNIQPFYTVNGSALVYRIRGDLNGNTWVDIGDASWSAYMVVGKTPELIPGADFNNNGVIDVGDASKIACYLIQKIPEL